ncbi:MAG: hypothetical protein ABSH08_05255 [Tepidisphaeraceae bacterium]|jgi:hypothetical protein
MEDSETHEQLKVNTEGDAGPYLMVPLEQLDAVRRVLQQNGIAYVVAEDAIELDDRPAIAIVDFGIGADTARIQAVLNAA